MDIKRETEPTGLVQNHLGQCLSAGPQETADATPDYEELFHFFNESPDLLCIADFDGHFKYLNLAWRSTLGWTNEELKAKPFLNFVHPADRPATLAEMARLDAGALTITFENRYLCQDGSIRWLQWTARPLPGRQEIYAIAREVTRRKRMEKEILDTLDRERERMGRELHDGLCQELAGIAAVSASLARRLAPVAEPEADTAREIAKLLGQTIRHARDLARDHDPLRLDAIGLVTALTNFCLKTEAMFQVGCSFHCQSRPPNLGAKRESHLYRITQEAVNNAITHGRATHIDIQLSYQNGGGTLAILDNGLGMGDSPALPSGSGLQTMAYRASLIGGSLEVNRNAPGGTAVICKFSLLSPNHKP